eukprot:gene40926-49921_t
MFLALLILYFCFSNVQSFHPRRVIHMPVEASSFDPYHYESRVDMMHSRPVSRSLSAPQISLPVVLISCTLLSPYTCHASDGDLPAQTLVAVNTIRPALDSFITVMNLLFLCRTVLSWYPKTDIKRFPYSLISWPTEPFMQVARSVVPPAFGVDISAIVWIMLLSFCKEVFTGQQGILTLIEKS